MAAYNRPDEEPPLDPAAERLRRKMARLLLISGGIMVLGFIAVFAALVYKLGLLGGPGADGVSAASGEAAIGIPAGARLVSSDLDGGRALLQLQSEDGTVSLVLVDLGSGRVLGRYALQSE